MGKGKTAAQKKAHNKARSLQLRIKKQEQSQCKHTGVQLEDGHQRRPGNGAKRGRKHRLHVKDGDGKWKTVTGTERRQQLRENCFQNMHSLPVVRREVYFVRSHQDIQDNHVVDKVPLPIRDEDIDLKCLRSYNVYKDLHCVETGARGDPPWQVEEDFPQDKITEIYMVHKQQKLNTAAFVIALLLGDKTQDIAGTASRTTRQEVEQWAATTTQRFTRESTVQEVLSAGPGVRVETHTAMEDVCSRVANLVTQGECSAELLQSLICCCGVYVTATPVFSVKGLRMLQNYALNDCIWNDSTGPQHRKEGIYFGQRIQLSTLDPNRFPWINQSLLEAAVETARTTFGISEQYEFDISSREALHNVWLQRYTPGEGRDQAEWHRDDAANCFSFVIPLWYDGEQCPQPSTSYAGTTVGGGMPVPTGHMLIHGGNLTHGSDPVLSGTRIVVVGFVRLQLAGRVKSTESRVRLQKVLQSQDLVKKQLETKRDLVSRMVGYEAADLYFKVGELPVASSQPDNADCGLTSDVVSVVSSQLMWVVFRSNTMDDTVRSDPEVTRTNAAGSVQVGYGVSRVSGVQLTALSAEMCAALVCRDLGYQLRDAMSELCGMSLSPMVTIRGQALQSLGIDSRDALGVANMTPEVLKVDMGQKRHHKGVGFVGDPGVRYRYTEPAVKDVSNLQENEKLKGGFSLKDPSCSSDKYWSYMARLQVICNAISQSAVWMKEELQRQSDSIREVWDHKGLACFAYMVCSVGLNFGAGFHLDKEDEGHALWGIAGEVEVAFPEANLTVRARGGDVLSFDARRYYHACVAMAESRQENAVFSLWNSSGQRVRLREEMKAVARVRTMAAEHRQEDLDEFGITRQDMEYYYQLMGM